MASQAARRYDPRYDDDPYLSRTEYPDPLASPPNDAYEYVGSEVLPEPPRHTFEPESPPRRRSPPRHHRSSRATTQPPKPIRHSSPPRSRRAASPPRRSQPHRSSRYSDSPPREPRHSSPARRPRRGESLPRQRRAESPPPRAADDGRSRRRSRHQQFFDKNKEIYHKPAVQNVKTYGRKGLHHLGQVVDAYAAAQAPPGSEPDEEEPKPKPRRSSRRYDPSPSPSPSPSPPRRRHSRREKEKRASSRRYESRSPSPPPRRSRDIDDDRGRRRRGERSRRRSPSYSISPSPPPRSRRGRSQAHPARESVSTGPASRRHSSWGAVKSHMKSPHPGGAQRWQMAARAALEAGGVAAFRLRQEPGSWAGDKGAKVATAALGAAAVDAFIDKDPRRINTGGMKGMAENAIGGMLASRLMGFKSATTRKGTPRYKNKK